MSLISTPTGNSSSYRVSSSDEQSAIQTDFIELQRMANELRCLARQVLDLDSILQGRCGDVDLDAALRHAEADWSSHRRLLGSFLDGTAGALERCLDAYEQTERAVAEAARR
jgi:hypothetical protein